MRAYPGPKKNLSLLQDSIDLDEAVSFLDQMAVRDLCVIRLPDELSYAKHMVICTCVSPRHLRACGMEVKKFIKSQLGPEKAKLAPVVEGSPRSADFWLAVDCGNVVIHLFEASKRQHYDLETLWTVGPAFDERSLFLKSLGIE
jgi:ribosome silencing factor RsfS/YbeB/iojap